MNKGKEILDAILLLKEMDTPKKLPLYHYVIDYFFTGLFLSFYGYVIYRIIMWLWV
tara:strand:+ start:15715 stop:15882 length:168 start_codon:yes stop_codon:yes gene_type:complete